MSIKINFEGGKKVNAEINGLVVKTDQPLSVGGEGSAPSPFEVFLTSLGTCAGIFIKSFCDQRGIATEKMYLMQDAEYNPIQKLVEKINISIHVPAAFPDKYDSALISTASLCTVKRHLREDIIVDIRVIRDK
ncbi:MAG: OsmC family protein [Lentimicrobiaceae bacterium]|nr:OsmC family protein [Lentimicrobiaceae bacterium]